MLIYRFKSCEWHFKGESMKKNTQSKNEQVKISKVDKIEIMSVVRWAVDVHLKGDIDEHFLNEYGDVEFYTEYLWQTPMKRLVKLFGIVNVEIGPFNKILRVKCALPVWSEIYKRYQWLLEKWEKDDAEV